MRARVCAIRGRCGRARALARSLGPSLLCSSAYRRRCVAARRRRTSGRVSQSRPRRCVQTENLPSTRACTSHRGHCLCASPPATAAPAAPAGADRLARAGAREAFAPEARSTFDGLDGAVRQRVERPREAGRGCTRGRASRRASGAGSGDACRVARARGRRFGTAVGSTTGVRKAKQVNAKPVGVRCGNGALRHGLDSSGCSAAAATAGALDRFSR